MNVAFEPNPGQQTKFLRSRVREVFYGGAGGGGKSEALRADPLSQVAMEDQRHKRGEIAESIGWAIHFRRVMPRLKQSIIRAQMLYRAADPGVKFDQNDHTFKFSCGFRVQFAHMEHENSYLDYLGPEYTHIAFDELTEFTEDQYTFLGTRLRTPDDALRPYLALRSASNPIGKGLIWVRRRFVEPAAPEKIIRTKKTLKSGKVVFLDRMFIPAKLSDNPKLDDGTYEADLMDRPPHIRRAILDGDWWVNADAFFGEIWRPNMSLPDVGQIPWHVCENRRPAPGTFRFRSCDYGLRAPASVTWWEVDFDGAMTAYHNLTVKNHTAKMLAHRIREIEEHYGDWDEEGNQSMLNFRSPLDAQCFKRTGTTGPTIAEEMAREGVRWIPSNKDRMNGAGQVVTRMTAEAGKGKSRRPMIRWMKRCEMPIRTIPVLPADPSNPEDVDTDADDHNYDDTMYACMSRPLTPDKDANKYDDDDDEDELADRRRRLASKGSSIAYGGW